MKRHLDLSAGLKAGLLPWAISLGLGLSGALLPACQQDPAPPDPAAAAFTPDAQAQALAALAKWSGSPWRVRYEPSFHTAAFLMGQSPPLADINDSDSAAKQFVLSYRVLFGIAADAELQQAGADTDSLGMRHVHFDQRISGVPLFGSALTVHLDKNGGVQRVHGKTWPLSQLAGSTASATPTLSKADGKQAALSRVAGEAPQASLSAEDAVLYFLPIGNQLTLSWRSEVYGQGPDLPIRREVFIDATTGKLVQESDRLAYLSAPQPATGSGTGALGDQYTLSITQEDVTYSLSDLGRGKTATHGMTADGKLPGEVVKSPDPTTWDTGGPGAGEAVDVHAHLATLWDFFAQKYGRIGWAGDGKGASAAVHYGQQANLALFDGKHLIFGDGDGVSYLPLGAALDVVAHEYTHAVLRSAADLASGGETGALEEGVADVFACLVEQAAQPDSADWTIGEAIYQPGGQMTPLRDLADPHQTDQAATFAEFQGGSLPDLGAGQPDPGAAQQQVQANAGIFGHAGYLLAQSAGNEPSGAVFYRAMTVYLHKHAGFFDAADALLAAVQDLYGPPAAAVDQVRAALGAVGVGSIETIGESSD